MVNRPNWTDLAVNLFRDFNTIGNPGSGIFLPEKPDLRVYFGEMEGYLNDLYDKAPTTLGSVGGSANAATATGTPTVDALAAGQSYWYKPTATNTTTGPTLNIDSLGAANLADMDGNDLPPGYMVIDRWHLLFFDGTKLRVVGLRDLMLYKEVDADVAGSDSSSAQPFFPTAGALTLPVGAWNIDAMLWLARTAGAVSHTTSILFAGTATYTIDWRLLVNTGDTAGLATPGSVAAAVATATQIKAASTSTTEQIVINLRATLKVTVAGTFIPQFQYSVAPGGAPSLKRGSYMRLIPRVAQQTSVGAWA